MTGSDSSPGSPKPFKVLVCGGSYAGLTAGLDIVKLGEGKSPTDYLEQPLKCHVPVEVTVVDERDGLFHVIGAPLALAEADYADRAWTRFSDIEAVQHPNLHLLHGSIKSVDSETMTATISLHANGYERKQSYDYLICATGYRRIWPTVPQSLDRNSYLEEARGHIDHVKFAEHAVVVIGGGAVGVEMAAEINMVYPDIGVSLIHARDHLFSAEPLPIEFADETLKLLSKSGVKVILGNRVVEVIDDDKASSMDKALKLSDGTSMHASHVFSAISRPTATSTYLPNTALDADGLIKVNDSLHFIADSQTSETHFAIGNVAAWPPTGTPTIKRCGGAMYMGHVATLNIYRQMLHLLGLAGPPEYTTIPVFPHAIAIALGYTAVGYWEGAGITEGDELRNRMSGDDRGLDICWRDMGLGSVKTDGTAIA